MKPETKAFAIGTFSSILGGLIVYAYLKSKGKGGIVT